MERDSIAGGGTIIFCDRQSLSLFKRSRLPPINQGHYPHRLCFLCRTTHRRSITLGPSYAPAGLLRRFAAMINSLRPRPSIPRGRKEREKKRPCHSIFRAITLHLPVRRRE